MTQAQFSAILRTHNLDDFSCFLGAKAQKTRFQKIFLKAGETKTITFNITPNDLKFYNSELKYDWEPGDFVIMVGGNSRDVKSAKVNWKK